MGHCEFAKTMTALQNACIPNSALFAIASGKYK